MNSSTFDITHPSNKSGYAACAKTSCRPAGQQFIGIPFGLLPASKMRTQQMLRLLGQKELKYPKKRQSEIGQKGPSATKLLGAIP